MRWSELVSRVAERSGTSKAATRRVLNAFALVSFEALESGEEVPLKGIATLSSRWQDARALRSIKNRRKIVLDGRYVPHVRLTRKLKTALANRTPQLWRDPRHQAAWRMAEALVGDLALYHAEKLPDALSPNATMEEVAEQCRSALGPVWRQAVRAYEQRVPQEIREQRQHLLLVARRQWSADVLGTR